MGQRSPGVPGLAAAGQLGYGRWSSVGLVAVAILLGALVVVGLDRVLPDQALVRGREDESGRLRRAWLFVFAIGGRCSAGRGPMAPCTTRQWRPSPIALPAVTVGTRADSTLDENECEIAMLNRAFGQMAVAAMEKGDAYECLDACLTATDKAGKPRPRAAKGNKEIALARLILELGVRRRWLKANRSMASRSSRPRPRRGWSLSPSSNWRSRSAVAWGQATT